MYVFIIQKRQKILSIFFFFPRPTGKALFLYKRALWSSEQKGLEFYIVKVFYVTLGFDSVDLWKREDVEHRAGIVTP